MYYDGKNVLVLNYYSSEYQWFLLTMLKTIFDA